MILDSHIHWYRYRAFGLVVASDRPLPCDEASEPGDEADLVLRGSTTLPALGGELFHDVEDYPGGPRLRLYGAGERVDVAYDRWRFSWERGKGVIGYVEHEGKLETDWSMVLERVILPLYVMTSRADTLALHGSAVELHRRAWIFVGDSGVGKSTTAYELRAAGANLLADDMTVIALGDAEETPHVLRGCPTVRLWRGEGALGDAIEDRPVHPITVKRWFRLEEHRPRHESIPLAGIIELRRVDDGSLSGTIARPRGHAALASLLRQTFDFTDPQQPWMLRRFHGARRLLESTPLMTYSYRPSSDGSPEHIAPLRQWMATFDAHLFSGVP